MTGIHAKRDPGGVTVRAFAPAKINLYLHIVGRHADGYHLLDSLIAFADIGDWVSVRPAEHLSLAVGGVGLFVAGALTARFTSRAWYGSGLRQLVLGLAAAGATFLIGKAIGVSGIG